MYNRKCIVEYDGTDFCGWQAQKEVRTVQSEIEKALATMYKTNLFAIGSGRTDAGVHALNQVFNFRTENYIPPEGFVMGINTILPKDIAVKSAEDVEPEFHSQKSAVSKTYMYRLLTRWTPSALDRNRAWWLKKKPDIELMAELLKAVEGEHDFACFCAAEGMKENTVRTIYHTKVYTDGDYIHFEINGSGFLHMMIRIITGTVVRGAFRKQTPADIHEIIKGKDRRKAGMTAPACGLYLKEVFY
ncbi:tRNA pseudouridine(38-40) synthase TruA [Geovibrio sp. ADMFC3]